VRDDERQTVHNELAAGDGWLTAQQMLGYQDRISADERLRRVRAVDAIRHSIDCSCDQCMGIDRAVEAIQSLHDRG